VIAVDPLASRRTKALGPAVVDVLDPREGPARPSALAQTDGRGADVAIVATDAHSAIADAFTTVRPGGVVMLFGSTRLGDLLPVDAGAVCMEEKSLLGSYSADVTLQAEAADLVFSGDLQVADLVTDVLPLHQITQAIDLSLHPRNGSLKVVIDPWAE
jgi:L-iditol 2-dehydrogenase